MLQVFVTNERHQRCIDPSTHKPIKKIGTNFYEAHKNMHFHIHPIKNNFLFGTLSSIPCSKPTRHTCGICERNIL